MLVVCPHWARAVDSARLRTLADAMLREPCETTHAHVRPPCVGARPWAAGDRSIPGALPGGSFARSRLAVFKRCAQVITKSHALAAGEGTREFDPTPVELWIEVVCAACTDRRTATCKCHTYCEPQSCAATVFGTMGGGVQLASNCWVRPLLCCSLECAAPRQEEDTRGD